MIDTPAPDPTLFDGFDDSWDEAAEMDDSVPSDIADDAPYEPGEDDFTGVCQGGPYAGRRVSCRFPDGFLLYDKARARVWTYRTAPDQPNVFIALDDGQPTQAVSPQNLHPVAEGVQYDVLAYDDGPAVA